MPFDSPDYPLGELMKDIGSGKIQLPDFQREWKWEDSRIKSLLESISLGYPVGVIMLLEVAGGFGFAPKPLAGVGQPEREPEYLLLDGQQRLTSLYQALASGAAVDTVDSRGKKMSRWYYVDIRRALDPQADPEDVILSIPEDRKRREDFGRAVVADYSTLELECEAEVFPLGIVFDPRAYFSWHARYTANDPDRADRWNALFGNVLDSFISYKLPAIILKKETPKEAVCVVFEKVNTGGVPLNVFELLTATSPSTGSVSRMTGRGEGPSSPNVRCSRRSRTPTSCKASPCSLRAPDARDSSQGRPMTGSRLGSHASERTSSS